MLGLVDITSKTMDDLVKFLFFELKENNEPISETQMQKLIFIRPFRK